MIWLIVCPLGLANGAGHAAEVLLPHQELGVRLPGRRQRPVILLHEQHQQHHHHLQQRRVERLQSSK